MTAEERLQAAWPGRLVIISGPSGVGKSALADRLVASTPVTRAVTATSRAPRPGERNGVDYWFWDERAFRDEIARGGLLEWAEVHGRLYGTPMAPLRKRLEAGETTLLVIDVQGALALKERGIPGIYVFIEPPSMEVLEQRLRSRASEAESEVALRLENARREMAERGRYDHRVVNDDLDRAVEVLTHLLGLRRERNEKGRRSP